MGVNISNPTAGLAAGVEQVWGFGRDTGIESKVFLAPGAKIFYVDPNNAQAVDFGNLGEDPTIPLATVQAAVTLCRDHRGDVIVVGPNDAWQYSPSNRPLPIAESVVIPRTKGGITLIAAATNPYGAQWNAGADSEYCLTVNAIDVTVDGFLFYEPATLTGTSGILADWNGVTANGENITVRNCAFNILDYGIALDYAWFNQIYNNQFLGCTVAAIFNVSTTGDSGYSHIHNNDFHENVLAISLPGAIENHIYNNRVFGDPAGAVNFIDLTDGATGDNLVSDNWLGCTLAQYAATCADGVGDQWIRNHCSDGETIANP